MSQNPHYNCLYWQCLYRFQFRINYKEFDNVYNNAYIFILSDPVADCNSGFKYPVDIQNLVNIKVKCL